MQSARPRPEHPSGFRQLRRHFLACVARENLVRQPPLFRARDSSLLRARLRLVCMRSSSAIRRAIRGCRAPSTSANQSLFPRISRPGMRIPVVVRGGFGCDPSLCGLPARGVFHARGSHRRPLCPDRAVSARVQHTGGTAVTLEQGSCCRREDERGLNGQEKPILAGFDAEALLLLQLARMSRSFPRLRGGNTPSRRTSRRYQPVRAPAIYAKRLHAPRRQQFLPWGPPSPEMRRTRPPARPR